MKKIILIPLLLLSLNSCSSKDDDNIQFSSELAKVEYCMDNIDSKICSFYRPMYVGLFEKIISRTSSSRINPKYMDTDAMSRYRFTEQYKKELASVVELCDYDNDDYRCSAFATFLKNSM